MSSALPFTKARIRRAVKGAESAGMQVRRVTINADGSITIDGMDGIQPALDQQGAPQLATSWDDV
jgi:hypothetical protein